MSPAQLNVSQGSSTVISDGNTADENIQRQTVFPSAVNVSSHTLLSDVLARASQDPSLVDQDHLPVMFKFLDDCLSSGAAITSSLRRSLVLDKFYWPPQGSRERVEDLPLIGSGLFDNKFDEVMLKEAKRLKTDERIDLRRQAPGSSSSWSALTAGKES